MDDVHALLGAGVFRIPGFLDPETCAAVLTEVRASHEFEASGYIGVESMTVQFDPRTRKGRNVKIGDEARRTVVDRVSEILPLAAARFRSRLVGQQDTQFLAYAAGDFYAFHRDTARAPGEPADMLRRKVSWVIFLNGETDAPSDGNYIGGALQFHAHDLVRSPELQDVAVSVHGSAGLFVAFDPCVLHRVQPVIAGERFTIVGGFE